MKNKKIHQKPLSEDLAQLTDKEAEELALADEIARMGNPDAYTEGAWVELTDDELAQLERPDHQEMLDNWYNEPLWSEVLPNLWQGGTAGDDEMMYGRALPEARITSEHFDTVVTMYAYAQAVDWHVKEIRHGIYDSDMQDFDPTELFEIVRTAHKDWLNGKRVLIRCQAGWNRSGLVMGLLLIRDGMPAKDAVTLFRNTRSKSALCNKHFVQFLLTQNAEDWQGDSYGAPEPEIKN